MKMTNENIAVSYDLDRLNDWTEKEKLRAIKYRHLSKQASLFDQGFKHRGTDLTLPDPNIQMKYGGPSVPELDLADQWINKYSKKDSEIYSPSKKTTKKITGAKSLSEIIAIAKNKKLASCSKVIFSTEQKKSLDKEVLVKLKRDDLFSKIDTGLKRVMRGKVLSANEKNLNSGSRGDDRRAH